MIPTLFFVGTLLLALTWALGLFLLWQGKPALALWSSALCALLGAGTALVTLAGPQDSELLFGSMNDGDGFAMIGLILFGTVAAGVAVVALILTAILAVFRKNAVKEKVQP